jgi:hypothetical protein
LAIRLERSLWAVESLAGDGIVGLHDERDDGRSFERWCGLAGMEMMGMDGEILFRDLSV